MLCQSASTDGERAERGQREREIGQTEERERTKRERERTGGGGAGGGGGGRASVERDDGERPSVASHRPGAELLGVHEVRHRE